MKYRVALAVALLVCLFLILIYIRNKAPNQLLQADVAMTLFPEPPFTTAEQSVFKTCRIAILIPAYNVNVQLLRARVSHLLGGSDPGQKRLFTAWTLATRNAARNWASGLHKFQIKYILFHQSRCPRPIAWCVCPFL